MHRVVASYSRVGDVVLVADAGSGAVMGACVDFDRGVIARVPHGASQLDPRWRTVIDDARHAPGSPVDDKHHPAGDEAAGLNGVGGDRDGADAGGWRRLIAVFRDPGHPFARRQPTNRAFDRSLPQEDENSGASAAAFITDIGHGMTQPADPGSLAGTGSRGRDRAGREGRPVLWPATAGNDGPRLIVWPSPVYDEPAHLLVIPSPCPGDPTLQADSNSDTDTDTDVAELGGTGASTAAGQGIDAAVAWQLQVLSESLPLLAPAATIVIHTGQTAPPGSAPTSESSPGSPASASSQQDAVAFVDRVSQLVAAAQGMGLRYLQHVVAVHAELRDGQLFPARRPRTDLPAHLLVHTDLVVLTTGGAL